MSNIFQELQKRGFIAQTSHPEELEALFSNESVTFYAGFDITADSLHAGHLMPMMMMMHLQRAGHRPLILMGGGTTMIGDPSGKTEMRSILTKETIDMYKKGIRPQLELLFDFSEGKALMLDNADWLLKLNYIDFLREIGSHFSVNRMLTAETYRARLDRPDGGLSFIELNYMIIQSYDFLHLSRELGCKVQIGGDDQWSNILSGADLIRRVDRKQAYAMTIPLLLNAEGNKMGKTVAGALWLDPNRTSPYEFYQYWRNTHDADVKKYLALLTLLPMEDVERLGAAEGSAINDSKKILAYEITKLIHGEAAAQEAAKSAQALFSGGGDNSAMPTTAVTQAELQAGVPILDALILTKQCPSKSDARRQVEQGGVSINNEKVTGIDHLLQTANLQDGKIIIRKGKKSYHAIVLKD
ncbi:MAG: tyrosine--tRNA ligase [Defluviitaleaceae bacterium]|nr:tyrosine--tRNA ligase [Defluviitaleaceae bacterium]